MKIENLLRELFPEAKFNPNDPDLGIGAFPEWDSLGNLNFLMLVEETYGVRFSVDDMAELKTLKSIKEKLSTFRVQA
jgi:acyl carrier protein